MNSFSFYRGETLYNRVSKKAAIKALENGNEILIMPCKANPCSGWYEGTFPVSMKYLNAGWRHYRIETNKQVFERYCNEYAAYNCNAETGRYLSYYTTL